MSENTPNNRSALQVLRDTIDRIDKVAVDIDYSCELSLFSIVQSGVSDIYEIPCSYCGVKNNIKLSMRMLTILEETEKYGAPFYCRVCNEITLISKKKDTNKITTMRYPISNKAAKLIFREHNQP